MGQKIEVYDRDGNLITVEDDRLLEDAIADKKNMVNIVRDEKIEEGYEWNGNIYDIDATSLSILANYTMSVSNGINLPPNFTWRTKDNTNVPLSPSELIQLNSILMLYVNEVYTYSWELKRVLDEMQDIEEVDAFDVEIGWP